MKAAEWIDKVKERKGWTDYRVAKELKFSPNTISMYRSRPDSLMDERIALKVSLALEIPPAAIILDQTAERSKFTEVKNVIRGMAHQLCILC